MSTAVPTLIVDSHVHLDEPAFDLDRDEVIAGARRAGVEWFINIAHTPARWETSRLLREQHPDLDFAIGVHPLDADEFNPQIERALRRAVHDLQPIAIGETGLDFFRSRPAPEVQRLAFQAQLAVAADSGLPMIIHQRNAAPAVVDMLQAWETPAPIVLHSWDGTAQTTDWAIERQCFIGIGGLAAKRTADDLRQVLRRVPVDRLLLETDAPYLPPPGAADKRNTPANLPRIAELLAPLWNLSGAELCQTTAENAERAFGPYRRRSSKASIAGGSSPTSMDCTAESEVSREIETG